MTGRRNAVLVPRTGTRLVPRRARITTRVQAPPALPTQRRATAHAWLRELLSVPPPHSYLANGETCVIATRFHWTAPLRKKLRAAVRMSLMGTVLFILGYLAPGAFIIQAVLFLAALGHTIWIGYVILR